MSNNTNSSNSSNTINKETANKTTRIIISANGNKIMEIVGIKVGY